MIVVKVIQPGSDSPEFYRFEEAPISIGRGIENRVIINDASISSRHCEIVENAGNYVIRDTGSLNGIVIDGKKKEEIDLGGRTKLYLGTVKVEIFTDLGPVEKTVRIDLEEWKNKSITEDRKVIMQTIGLFFAGICLNIINYSQKAIQSEMMEMVLVAVSSTLGYAVIALLISIYSKVHARKYQYFRVLRPFALISFVVEFEALFGQVLEFNFPSQGLYLGIKYLAGLVLMFWLLFSLGKTIYQNVNPKKLAAISSAILILFIVTTRGVDFYRSRQGNGYDFSHTLAYPLFNMSHSSRGFDSLFKEFDNAYKEILEDKKEEDEKKKEQDLRFEEFENKGNNKGSKEESPKADSPKIDSEKNESPN